MSHAQISAPEAALKQKRLPGSQVAGPQAEVPPKLLQRCPAGQVAAAVQVQPSAPQVSTTLPDVLQRLVPVVQGLTQLTEAPSGRQAASLAQAVSRRQARPVASQISMAPAVLVQRRVPGVQTRGCSGQAAAPVELVQAPPLAQVTPAVHAEPVALQTSVPLPAELHRLAPGLHVTHCATLLRTAQPWAAVQLVWSVDGTPAELQFHTSATAPWKQKRTLARQLPPGPQRGVALTREHFWSLGQASETVHVYPSAAQTSTPPPLVAQRLVPGVQVRVQRGTSLTMRQLSRPLHDMKLPFHASPVALQVSMPLAPGAQRLLPASQMGGGGGQKAVGPSLWQVTPLLQVDVVLHALPAALHVSTAPPEALQRWAPGAQMGGGRQLATPGPPQP